MMYFQWMLGRFSITVGDGNYDDLGTDCYRIGSKIVYPYLSLDGIRDDGLCRSIPMGFCVVDLFFWMGSKNEN